MKRSRISDIKVGLGSFLVTLCLLLTILFPVFDPRNSFTSAGSTTWGNTSTGTSSWNCEQTLMAAGGYRCSASGTIDKVVAYFKNTDASNTYTGDITCGIYQYVDHDTFFAGSQLALQTNASVSISASSYKWVTFTFSTPYTGASGTWYYFVFTGTADATGILQLVYSSASGGYPFIGTDTLPLANPLIGEDAEDLNMNFSAYAVSTTDTTAPSATINFAGNHSDKGGPYWLPPGESTALSGSNLNGYYTNGSYQAETWMYINTTVTDAAGVKSVKLHWYNATTNKWWNTSEVSSTLGFVKKNTNYYEINTSVNITNITAGHKYSFDIWSYDASSNCQKIWWNKTGVGGTATRRYVHLKNTPSTLVYTPLYIYNITLLGTGNKADRLLKDFGEDNGIYDTSFYQKDVPGDDLRNPRCGSFVTTFIGVNNSIIPFTLTNIYFHIWYTMNDTEALLAWASHRGAIVSPTLIQNYTVNNADSRSSLHVSSTPEPDFYNQNYNLTTHLLSTTSTSITDNNMYEILTFFKDIEEHPSIISNRSITSFILLNVPSNATLNASYVDSDSDGMHDWDELYRNYTNPFLADTDNDGFEDPDEILSGTDPNNYSDPEPITSDWYTIQTISGVMQNTTSFKTLQTISGTLQNTTSFRTVQTISGTILNTTGFKTIQTINGILQNTTGFRTVQTITGTILNTTGFKTIQTLSGTIFNTTSFKTIQTISGEIKNTSVSAWQTAQTISGILLNTTGWETVQTITGLIENTTGFRTTQTITGTFLNTTGFKTIQTIDGELLNATGWRTVQTLTGVILNASVSNWRTVQTIDGEIQNVTGWITIQTITGYILNTTGFRTIQTLSGTILNATAWKTTQTVNGAILNLSGFKTIQTISGAILNTTAFKTTQTITGTILNTTGFKTVQTINGVILNMTAWRTVQTLNGTIQNISETHWHTIQTLTGIIQNTTAFRTMQTLNGVILNTTAWKTRQTITGEILNATNWETVQTINGTILNLSESKWYTIQTINGELLNTTNWVTTQTIQGSILNTTGFKTTQTIQGDILNTTAFKTIQTISGTIMNTSGFRTVQTINGTILNISVANWATVQTINGVILNSTGWMTIQTVTGTLLNSTRWVTRQTITGTILNTTGFKTIQTINGTFRNGSWQTTQIINGVIMNTSLINISILSYQPLDNATGVCPCDPMCVEINATDNVNMTVYRKSHDEVVYYLVANYTNISAGERCFPIEGHIDAGMLIPIFFNETYDWYAYIEYYNDTTVNYTSPVYNFTTEVDSALCAGGGLFIMSPVSNIGIIGLVGIIGIIGFMLARRRRRKRNDGES